MTQPYDPRQPQGPQQPHGNPQWQGQPLQGQPKKKRGGCLKWFGISAAALVAFIVMISAINSGDSENGTVDTDASSSESVSLPSVEQNIEPVVEPEQKPASESDNAVKKAEQYLDYTAFSQQGLVEQLEFEGFSPESAQNAAANVGADWNEQAAKKGQQYLDYSSFSPDGLVEQLTFEGFTPEQAQYAVDQLFQ